MRSILIAAICIAGPAHAAWGDYEEVRDLSLNASEIHSLGIEARAGQLEIRGISDTDTIVVKAIIQVLDDDDEAREIIESDLVLSLEKGGDRAELRGFFEDSGSLFGNDRSLRLEVTLPERLSLDVQDGSGSLSVHGVAGDITVNDGSGSIKMTQVGGNVSIEDGSGSISAGDVGGNLSVVDGSGSLSVTGAAGDVTIDDGSGGITVSGVGKDLTILEAGSGSLNIMDVTGEIDTET